MSWRRARTSSSGSRGRCSPSTSGTCPPRCTISSWTPTALGCSIGWRTRGLSSTRSSGYCVGDNVLKGTRDGILKKVQPTSIHGQISWDVYFTDVEDPDGQISVARVGPEAVMGNNLEPGDRIQVEYVVGVAIRVTRL